jgi:hypothetical protein
MSEHPWNRSFEWDNDLGCGQDFPLVWCMISFVQIVCIKRKAVALTTTFSPPIIHFVRESDNPTGERHALRFQRTIEMTTIPSCLFLLWMAKELFTLFVYGKGNAFMGESASFMAHLLLLHQ